MSRAKSKLFLCMYLLSRAESKLFLCMYLLSRLEPGVSYFCVCIYCLD